MIGGSLNRGPHFFANALGHITLVPDGHPCSCGKRGCLEAYANASALLRFAGGSFKDAEQAIAAAQAGDSAAADAIRTLAGHLAAGVTSIIQILDPEMIILSGGIVENNPLLLHHFQNGLKSGVPVWEQRRIQVQVSCLGYFSGVLGAVAAVLEKIERDTRARSQFAMQSPTSLVPGMGKEAASSGSPREHM